MATGKLGSGSLAANTWTAVTMAAGQVVNINLTNTSNTTNKVDIYIGGGTGTPSGGAYIEYQADLEVGVPLERTGFVVSQGDKVWLRSNNATTDYYVHGIEAQ